MMNRGILILLIGTILAFAWYFTSGDEPVGDSIVVTSSERPVANSNTTESSVADPGLRMEDVRSGVSSQAAEKAAGGNIAAVGESARQPSTVVRKFADAAIAADEPSADKTTAAVDQVDEAGMDKVVDESDDVEQSEKTDTQIFDYQVSFRQTPSTAVGAVDLTLDWDGNRLSPANTQAVCVDRSGAALFQQGRVTASNARFALLYPSGMGSVSTLLSCQFSAASDLSQSGILPKISGELLNVQGSVIGNLSSVLQVTL